MFSYTARKLSFQSFCSQELQIPLPGQYPCSKHLKRSSQKKEVASSLLTVIQLKKMGFQFFWLFFFKKSLRRVKDLFLL